MEAVDGDESIRKLKAQSVPSTDGTRGHTINQKFPPPVETD